MIPHNKTFLSHDDIKSVIKQLEGGIINDSEVSREFETLFKKYIGAKYAQTTSTGTLALCLALRLISVGSNDTIITTTYTCKDVLAAIRYTGAKARLIDIDPDDYNIDVDKALNKIDHNVKAIIVPHMFGVPANINRLLETGIYIIEDCAWALGSKLDGRFLGTIGDFGTFSFHALKGIVTGEGGMLVSKRSFDNLPGFVKYQDSFNVIYHLSNLLSVLGISQLKRIKSILEKRKLISDRYNALLDNTELKLPVWKRGDGALLRYCIQLPEYVEIDKLRAFMLEKGIVLQRPVKELLHIEDERKQFPVAESIFRRTLSLPAHLHVTEGDQHLISESLIKYLNKETTKN